MIGLAAPHTHIAINKLISKACLTAVVELTVSSPSNTHVQSCHVQYQTSLAWQSHSSSLDLSHLSPNTILEPSLLQSIPECQSYTGSLGIIMGLPHPPDSHNTVSQNARFTPLSQIQYIRAVSNKVETLAQGRAHQPSGDTGPGAGPPTKRGHWARGGPINEMETQAQEQVYQQAETLAQAKVPEGRKM